MGKHSKYNKQKELNYANRYTEKLNLLPSFTHEFLNSKANINTNTAIAYSNDLLSFFEYLKDYCPAIKNTDIKDIDISILDTLTYKDINEYQNYLNAKHPELSGSKNYQNHERGIARKMSTLRGLYKYEFVHHNISNDPTSGANPTPVNSNDHQIVRLTTSEVKTLLKTINDGVGSERQQNYQKATKLRDYAIVYLLLNTGIRVSECVGLDIDDINFNENTLLVVRKGKKEHHLYFDNNVALVLKDYIDNERPNFIVDSNEKALFLSNRKKRIAVRSIQEMLAKYAEVAVSNKKISPHKMRSTYGTALYNRTGDIRMVGDVLGHANINVTIKSYAAIEEKRRKMAASVNPYEDD